MTDVHADEKNPCKTESVKLPTATKKKIIDVFTEAEAEGEDDRAGTQGTSVPPAKPMCPQCAWLLTASLRT